MNKRFLPLLSVLQLTTYSIIILAFLTGCSNSQVEVAAPSATIELTEIVDKSTQRLIAENTITLRWETNDGEVLDTQEYKNQSSLITTLVADGDTRLWVKVVSPGYKPWENAIMMKLNSDKPLYIKVELERWDAIQG